VSDDTISQAPFNVGDVVRLKSGSPKLTVEYVYLYQPHIKVGVCWFDGSQTMRYEYPDKCLEPAGSAPATEKEDE
jgi:uncharacterized protein YodC (DUF2158 family)